VIDMQDELNRKALDQVGHLLAAYEGGSIGAEAFRTGVETIWACLGGIVRLEAFEELMQEANAEVRALPASPQVSLYSKGGNIVALLREGDRTNIVASPGVANVKVNAFNLEDEAIAYLRKTETALQSKGYEKVTACD
jgi:hypothetical protein